MVTIYQNIIVSYCHSIDISLSPSLDMYEVLLRGFQYIEMYTVCRNTA